jgi:hydrogenase maturation protease
MMNITRLIIFAYGNPSRGDDALGPEFLRRLGEEPACQAGICNYKQITDFQLQIEHAEDLLHRDLALFIDASMAGPPPFSFYRLTPARDTSYSTHAMSPAAVLHVFEQAYRRASPPAYMLTIRGVDFALGHPISARGREYLDAAVDFARRLISRPDSDFWTHWAGSL